MSKIEVWFDGACEPVNPGGQASYGYIIRENGEIIQTGKGVIGKGPLMSCNVAECVALHKALNWLFANNFHEKFIQVYGDSNLIINKASGNWKKKAKGLYAPFLESLRETVQLFEDIDFKWIPREMNVEADELSKA